MQGHTYIKLQIFIISRSEERSNRSALKEHVEKLKKKI